MTYPDWDPAKSVSANARERLPELAGRFFNAGREVAEPGASYTALHHFRLQSKSFRYILELFDDYYGPGLKKKIESLQNVQQLLGAISDCSATLKLLAKRKDLSVAERAILRRKLEEMARIRIAEFQSLWTKDFSAPARERSWKVYLSRFARAKRTG